MDVWNKITKIADHDRWKCIGVLVALLAATALLGCQSRTASVLSPGEKVTRPQLQAEATALTAKVEAGFADLDQQDAYKRRITEALKRRITEALSGAAMAATQGTLSPGEKVTRPQLQAEAAALTAKVEAGFADLDRQDAYKRRITEALSGAAMAATQGTLSPATTIAAVTNLALLGLAGGAVADGRRKDKLIGA